MRDERGIWLVNKKNGKSVLLAVRRWGTLWEPATDHIWQDLADFLKTGDTLQFADLALRNKIGVKKKAVW